MSNYNLLEIYYDRVVSVETIILTPTNCQGYGYSHTTRTINGTLYNLYYKTGDTSDNYIKGENGLPINVIEKENVERFTHIAPPPSKYEISYADVDKEGSGRNSLTGEMFRERIGYYTMLTISWDLIPNSIEYHNWYKVLTSLPSMVYLKLLMPNGDIEEKAYYRGDISTNLYLFVAERQMWQGLSTTFTEWYVNKYNESVEPSLDNNTTEENVNTLTMVKVIKEGITKLIQEHNLDEYLKLGWVLVE